MLFYVFRNIFAIGFLLRTTLFFYFLNFNIMNESKHVFHLFPYQLLPLHFVQMMLVQHNFSYMQQLMHLLLL